MTVLTAEIKSPREVGWMRESGRVLAEVFDILVQAVREGIDTKELDRVAGAEIRRRKAKAAFLNYRGFPSSLCVSVNDELIHGIPSGDRVLKGGDIVSLDMGVILRGYYTDAAVTVPVGKVSQEADRLINVTRGALYNAIEEMKPGRHLGDVSHAIQSYVESHGMNVVRQFVGHGIGRRLHEDPPVPNYGQPGSGPALSVGTVLAIEPMVNLGGPEVRVLPNGWTAVTQDGKLSAHFEHTVAVKESGSEVLTAGYG